MENPDKYVGHIVCLKQHVFQRIMTHARRQGITLDNRFLVATASHKLRKLVCYGADYRVTVSVSEVALV
ncbi:MAG TPA: hypothetical protein VFF82_03060 [Rhodocyclaceae bacterium]|nr:hypothetical protein [Rhodocyclaceae bacterium]